MAKPKIEVEIVPIGELIQDDRNANRHTERGNELLSKSIGELGLGRSVLVDANGKLIAGNGVQKQALAAGKSKALIVDVDGDTLLVARRKDLDLDDPNDPRARQMALVDNSSALAGIDFDFEVAGELGAEFGFDVGEWGLELPGDEGEQNGDGNTDGEENGYSKKIKAPVYEPKNEKPQIGILCNTSKTDELLAQIEAANLPKEEKEFLRKAAARHNVFNYELIADYYAHSTPEIQRLMENSALVIIDFERAIELGFVRLGEEIANQYLEEYGNEE